MHRQCLLFFTAAVAVTVVVVTNLPVNFAVDLAGAMRQGRQHLFHLARTHRQTHTHIHTQANKHTHTTQEKASESWNKKTWRAESNFWQLFWDTYSGSFCLPLTVVVLQSTPPPSFLPLLYLYLFLPHALCIFLSVKFNFHIEWNTSRLKSKS